ERLQAGTGVTADERHDRRRRLLPARRREVAAIPFEVPGHQKPASLNPHVLRVRKKRPGPLLELLLDSVAVVGPRWQRRTGARGAVQREMQARIAEARTQQSVLDV